MHKVNSLFINFPQLCKNGMLSFMSRTQLIFPLLYKPSFLNPCRISTAALVDF